MKKRSLHQLIVILLILIANTIQAQIGIGNASPDPSSVLDVTSANSGVLIPRINLLNNTDVITIPTPATSLLVYNSGFSPNGYYYWNGSTWVQLATAVANADWLLTGNTGTTAGTNYLGTTDAVDLRFKTGATDRWNISNTNNGQLQSYSLGTDLLPAYSFQSDQNTGVYSPAADNLSITTNGAEKMRVTATGQVGIGTTAPNGALDVTSTTDGLLIPRIALSATNVATVTTPTVSELVYNTFTSAPGPNQVIAGYYYWNGSLWIQLATGASGTDWLLTGNTGTTAGTNYLGTADAVDLRFKTGATDRWNISNANNGQLQSYALGTNLLPSYSFQSDQNTGMFSSGADALDFTTGGTSRFRIPNANQVHALSLGTAALPFYSFNADANTGLFSSGADALDFSTNGNARFRIPNADQVHALSLGNQGAPFYSFAADTNTGIFSSGNNNVDFSTGGTARFRIPDADQVHALSRGTAAAPFYTFSQDILNNTGMFSSSENNLDFSTFGNARFRIPDSDQVHALSLGTAGLPFYSFSADVNTGVYSPGNDILSISTGGTERMRIEADGDVGIGVNANPSARLEINSNNRGLLIPNVALTAKNVAGPIAAPATSLLVYNTATAGVSPNNVVPGYYYWNGTAWIGFTGSGGNDWAITGNAGTTAANYVGTSDAVSLKIATNGLERMRVLTTTGQVVVNNTLAPIATDRFSVYTLAAEDAVNGYSSSTGTGVYGENTGAGNGVWGGAYGNLGYGVWGTTTSTNGFGVRGDATGTGSDGVYGEATQTGRYGVVGINNNASGNGVGGSTTGTNGIGVFGVSSGTNGTGVLGSQTQNARAGVNGVNNNATLGYGVLGTTTGGGYGVYGTGTTGYGVVGSTTGATGFGVFGTATGTAGTGVYGVATQPGRYGVNGVNNNATGIGVFGSTSGIDATSVLGASTGNNADGVTGQATGATGYGVWGINNNATGNGVVGQSSGNTANGVAGVATGTSGYGVFGSATGATGYGVFGVNNNATGNGVGGTSSGNSGNGVLGAATGVNGYGVYGTASGTNGFGVYGVNNDATGIGVVGSTSGATAIAVWGTATGAGADAVFGSASGATGFGAFGSNSNAIGTGVVGAGNNLTATYSPAGSGAAFTGLNNGTLSYSTGATGTGIAAAGNNQAITSFDANGAGGAFTGYQWGTTSIATITGAANDGIDRGVLAGTYTSSGSTLDNVYVGAQIGGVNYKILGTGGGSVSTTMKTSQGEKILFAPEAPENWFFDIGEVELINGAATVHLDPTFVETISDAKPFKVFVQGGENTLGSIRITRNQKDKSFLVEDLGGPSNGTVQYNIYAIWKGKENVRFPEFKQESRPKPTQLQSKTIDLAAKNNSSEALARSASSRNTETNAKATPLKNLKSISEENARELPKQPDESRMEIKTIDNPAKPQNPKQSAVAQNTK